MTILSSISLPICYQKDMSQWLVWWGIIIAAGLFGRGFFHEGWARWRVLSGRQRIKMAFDYAVRSLIIFLRNNIILSKVPKGNELMHTY